MFEHRLYENLHLICGFGLMVDKNNKIYPSYFEHLIVEYEIGIINIMYT